MLRQECGQVLWGSRQAKEGDKLPRPFTDAMGGRQPCSPALLSRGPGCSLKGLAEESPTGGANVALKVDKFGVFQ